MIKTGMVQGSQRCLLAQLIIVSVVAVGLWLGFGVPYFQASAYGGMLGMLNTAILARRVNRGKAAEDLLSHARLGQVERLAVTVVFLVLAFLKLDLLPLPLILTLLLTYLGYFFTGK